jgi:hypothetical protein
MAGGRERAAVADFEQDPGCGPDPDPGHRDQDLRERVRIEHLLDLNSDLIALFQQVTQAVRQLRQDGLGRSAAGNDHSLGVQGGEDLLDQPGTQARSYGSDDLGEFRPAGLA